MIRLRWIAPVLIGLTLAAGASAAEESKATQEAKPQPPRRGLAPLPQGVTSFGGAVDGDWVYVYGGHMGEPHDYNRLDYFNGFLRMNVAEQGEWETLEMGPTMQGLAMVAHEGKVYRIGGMAARNAPGEEQDLHSTAVVSRYDPATDAWTHLTPLPAPSSSHDAAVLDGKVYVVGGWTLNGSATKPTWLEHGWVADLSKEPLEWKPLPPLPAKRRALAVAATDKYVYAIGGLKERGMANEVYRYDPETGAWAEGPAVAFESKMAGFGAAAFGVGPRVWLSGHDGRVFYLHDDAEAWTDTGHTLKEPRFFHRVLPHSGRLLFIGGTRHDRIEQIETVDIETLTTPAAQNIKAAPTEDVQQLRGKATGSTSWPGFRGAGDSHTEARDLPLKWTADENVAWSVDLPGYGQSSPVVHGGKVYVTSLEGANQETLHVVCVALGTGKALWTKSFPATQTVEASGYVSKAAPTPAVDAAGVYAFFESGDLIALDHAGQVRWTRKLTDQYGKFIGNHGLGASIAQTADSVIVLVDHDGPSYLLSVDKSTGENRWKIDREPRVSWSSPIVTTRNGQTEIIVSSNGRVEALDAATGAQRWYLDGLKGNTVPSPTVTDELVLIGSTDRDSCIAVKRGGAGALKASHVAWSSEQATSSFGSPLVHGDSAYYVNKAGVAFRVDLATGKTVWAFRLPDSCWASPVAAGRLVYFFCKDGSTVVIEAGGAEPMKVAESTLPVDDKTRLYGIAAIDGAFVIRNGGSRLTCVGKPAADAVTKQ